MRFFFSYSSLCWLSSQDGDTALWNMPTSRVRSRTTSAPVTCEDYDLLGCDTV
jgi:hypothetical protein